MITIGEEQVMVSGGRWNGRMGIWSSACEWETHDPTMAKRPATNRLRVSAWKCRDVTYPAVPASGPHTPPPGKALRPSVGSHIAKPVVHT
jgi:hypothetical protein